MGANFGPHFFIKNNYKNIWWIENIILYLYCQTKNDKHYGNHLCTFRKQNIKNFP